MRSILKICSRSITTFKVVFIAYRVALLLHLSLFFCSLNSIRYELLRRNYAILTSAVYNPQSSQRFCSYSLTSLLLGVVVFDDQIWTIHELLRHSRLHHLLPPTAVHILHSSCLKYD